MTAPPRALHAVTVEGKIRLGRTVPSFRIETMAEGSRWEKAGSRLSSEERQMLRETVRAAKLYASAASMAVRTSVFEAFFMSLLFDTYRRALDEQS